MVFGLMASLMDPELVRLFKVMILPLPPLTGDAAAAVDGQRITPKNV